MYLFLVRHFNDYDHVSPIIYSLISNGIESENITIFFSSYNNINEFKNNFRTKLFQNYKINIVFSNSTNLFDKYMLGFINNNKNISDKISYFKKVNIFFKRKIAGIIYRILYKQYEINNKIIKIRDPIKNFCFQFIKENSNSVLIFDHVGYRQYIKILNFAKKNNCKCISVPHGLAAFKQPQKYFDEFKKTKHFLNEYSKVIVTSSYHKSILLDEGLQNDIIILDPPRFDKRWTKIMREHARNIGVKVKRLNVIFFLEKAINYYNKEKYVLTDNSGQMKIIDYLYNHKEIDLLIKINTRGINVDQLSKLKKYSSVVINDEYESHELINWSDVVISAGATSVIFDAIDKSKNIICATYLCPSFKFEYHKFNYPKCVSSLKDLKVSISNLLISKDFSFDESERVRFLNYFTGKNQDKMLSYKNFLVSLTK